MNRLLGSVGLVTVLAILFTLTSEVVFPDSLMVASSLVQLVILAAILERLDRENNIPGS